MLDRFDWVMFTTQTRAVNVGLGFCVLYMSFAFLLCVRVLRQIYLKCLTGFDTNFAGGETLINKQHAVRFAFRFTRTQSIT